MRIFRDGNAWCATEDDFLDLQASPAGFGDTPTEAARALIDELQKHCTCGNNGGGDCDACQRAGEVSRDSDAAAEAAKEEGP